MTDYIETRLHIAVADYLRGIHRVKGKEYPITVPFPGLMFTHPANQGRSPREGHKLKMMGVRAGVPDFIVWWGDTVAGGMRLYSGGIELKSNSGIISAAQKKFYSEFTRIGGKYAVCRTVGEVRDILIDWGLKCENMSPFAPDISKQEKMRLCMEMFRP